MDISRYYLLANFTALKLGKLYKYELVAVQK